MSSQYSKALMMVERVQQWTSRDFWLWPKHDRKLLEVFDWVNDLDLILKHVPGRGICIQAGGACGVWPKRLAQEFAWVYTFEPCSDNFVCLTHNAPEPNIIRIQAALGYTRGPVHLKLDELEDENAGAFYTRPGGRIPTFRVDDLDLPGCDLIQLDIEGGEFWAIQGAQATIQTFKPVVVLEEKPLPHMGTDPAAARKLLEAWGYRVRARAHNDLVLSC